MATRSVAMPRILRANTDSQSHALRGHATPSSAPFVHNPKNLARMYHPGAQPLGHSPIPTIFRLADAPPRRTLGPMHTTPTTDAVATTDILTQLRQAEARLVMQRVQTRALQTLQALMDEPEPTGDPKQDAFIARERNRRRLAATQALTHIRAVEREQRIAAKARAKADKQTERSQKPESPSVPLAARPPVPGRKTPSNAPVTPATPSDPPPPGFTTLDAQQAYLAERKQATTKARARKNSRKRRKR